MRDAVARDVLSVTDGEHDAAGPAEVELEDGVRGIACPAPPFGRGPIAER